MGIEELFDGSMEPEAPAVEAPVEATPAPEAVEQPAPEPAPEPEAPAEPAKEDERNIPLPTFLDMRDRAKAAERRAAELEAQNAPRPTPPEMPDPIDDPQGFADWQTGQVQQALVNQRFEMSDLMAKQQHGEEVVKTAAEWATERAKTDPAFRQAYMQQPHPLDWIVREHKRNGLLTEIGDNVDDWFTREAAKRGYAAVPAPNAAATGVVAAQAQPAPSVPSPPRSLAAEPGKGGGVKEVPTGPMAALEAVFQR
jgi:hypothetical protein